MQPVDVSRYIDLPYSQDVRLEVDDEGNEFYTATHLEMHGCRGQGASPEEAVASLRDAREMYLEALIESGLEVPQPIVWGSQCRGASSSSIVEVPTDGEPVQMKIGYSSLLGVAAALA